jgi:hypothetical protein
MRSPSHSVKPPKARRSSNFLTPKAPGICRSVATCCLGHGLCVLRKNVAGRALRNGASHQWLLRWHGRILAFPSATQFGSAPKKRGSCGTAATGTRSLHLILFLLYFQYILSFVPVTGGTRGLLWIRVRRTSCLDLTSRMEEEGRKAYHTSRLTNGCAWPDRMPTHGLHCIVVFSRQFSQEFSRCLP